MAAEKTPVDVPLGEEEDFDEEEQALLESHIKKNSYQEPQQFTVLYYLISTVTVCTICYVFLTILNLSVLEPVNALLYLVCIGATAHFLAESYQLAYETESNKALTDDKGKFIKELELRAQTRSDSIKNKTKVKKVNVPKELRTAQEIFKAQRQHEGDWRDLSKADKQLYYDFEAAEEAQLCQQLVSELRHFQYQKTMGYSLLICNLAFLFTAVLVSQVLLRKYDDRLNLICSTVLVGLGTSILAKQLDEQNNLEKKKKN